MKPHTIKELYTADEIAARVSAIAAEVNRTYQGEDLVVLCVLKGAFMFFSDLLKLITVRPQIDFVRLASYGSGVGSSGTISFTKDAEISLKDKHVLIVEDVVDSGGTMAFLLGQLRAREVKSLRIAALVDKVERRSVDVTVDFFGFRLTEGFIIGYGLDYAERYREIPNICTVEFTD